MQSDAGLAPCRAMADGRTKGEAMSMPLPTFPAGLLATPRPSGRQNEVGRGRPEGPSQDYNIRRPWRNWEELANWGKGHWGQLDQREPGPPLTPPGQVHIQAETEGSRGIVD